MNVNIPTEILHFFFLPLYFQEQQLDMSPVGKTGSHQKHPKMIFFYPVSNYISTISMIFRLLAYLMSYLI